MLIAACYHVFYLVVVVIRQGARNDSKLRECLCTPIIAQLSSEYDNGAINLLPPPPIPHVCRVVGLLLVMQCNSTTVVFDSVL